MTFYPLPSIRSRKARVCCSLTIQEEIRLPTRRPRFGIMRTNSLNLMIGLTSDFIGEFVPEDRGHPNFS